MKRVFCLLISGVIFICFLAGCSEKPDPSLSLKNYVFEDSTETVKPYVSLQKENKFEFMYSVLSSYTGYGSYKAEEDSLILKTSDGKYTYRFKIKDSTLVYQAEQSAALPSFANVPDGAVFQ